MQRILQRVGRWFRSEPKPAILMYHRVADLPYDPWGLAVSPQRFAAQMASLKAERLPLPMDAFVAKLEDGTLPSHAVAVTFDDGYLDNLTHAKPLLDQAGVPATIFLATGQLGQDQEFWWDELARLVLGQRGGADGQVCIQGRSITVHLPPLAFDEPVRTDWRAWQPAKTPRQRLYFDLWSALRALDEAARLEAMEALRRIFREEASNPADLAMQPTDIARLIAQPGIDIGAHSRTHQPLPALPRAERRAEIDGSRADCERLTGRPVTGFAYPYGDRDAETIKMVRDLGFAWACSTHDAPVDPARFDRFDLPRRQVLDWDSAEFERELGNARSAA
jgi:peptidoglycan/xylan/chitin deacetylase (PgdA/CDA1 family)